MPQPEGSQLNFGYSPILTNIGINLLPSLDTYIGRKLFPTVPSASPTGSYPVWKQGDFLRRNGKKLANYEPAPLAGFATGQGQFSVENWGLGTPYTARDLADARRGGTSDQRFKNMKSRFVTTQAVMEMEFRTRDLIQTTGNWSTTYAGVASAPSASQFIQWDNASSTPVDDVLSWKRRMRLLTGFEPNTFVMPESVYLALRKNAQIIARITPAFYGSDKPVEVGLDHIKQLFEIPNIWIPKGTYNTAAEGQADSLADIWNNNICWFGYVTDTPSMETPTAGYNFAWTGDTTVGLPAGITSGQGPNPFGSVMNNEGLFVREYFDPPKAAFVIEGTIWSQPNVTSAALGATLTAVLASPI